MNQSLKKRKKKITQRLRIVFQFTLDRNIIYSKAIYFSFFLFDLLVKQQPGFRRYLSCEKGKENMTATHMAVSLTPNLHFKKHNQEFSQYT